MVSTQRRGVKERGTQRAAPAISSAELSYTLCASALKWSRESILSEFVRSVRAEREFELKEDRVLVACRQE